MRSITTILGTCVLGVVACSGCSSLSKNTTSNKKDSWSISKFWKKEYQKPQSLAAIWSPDVMTMPGQVPTRGFGGRIYFYNELSQAVPVEGDLMVHGYMAQPKNRRQSEQVAADKAFAFTAEQLVSHFSPSEIGASYSIWIPWDAAGGMRQEITLIPTFKSKDGTIVQGAPAKVNLPGQSEEDEDGSEGSSLMQTVSYRSSSTPTNPGIALPVIDTSKPATKLRSITIGVPPNSSIAKPKIVNSFSLTNDKGAEHVVPVSTGVSVGGVETAAASMPSPIAQPTHLPSTAPAVPGKTSNAPSAASSHGVELTPIDLKNLPQPPVHHPLQVAPFRLSPWVDRTGEFGPASK